MVTLRKKMNRCQPVLSLVGHSSGMLALNGALVVVDEATGWRGKTAVYQGKCSEFGV